ncbi:LruC domain-containing protein [Leptospira sp. GIMC2001]|uniref:LruC domain-containing protein n=1 Tax=Leptospira sp. GIMC2001 TaxID=1513297 RepID=UPI00234BB490|nr:LruC domain-containing protein [Leptospira sp. GIMC2001]WCL50089.1 LruC domain-containing protein [Leptospira sp. GIMC2001]
MNKNKTLIILFVGLLFSSCATQEDENYAWLVTLFQPVAPVEEGTDPPLSEPDDTDPVTVPFSMDILDINGPVDFLFENTTTFPIRVVVKDPNNPVNGLLVQVRNLNPDNVQTVIFRAVTDESGAVTGSFTINNRAEPKVMLEVIYMGTQYFIEVDLQNVLEINRDVYIWINQIEQIANPDLDSDSVPNDLDDYPEDPNRATKIRIPSESYYTIAYEDLYPKQGDADFNDYVIRVINEEDLNKEGKVVRIRGEYTHVAKGAGYNHTLNLRLPSVVAGDYTLRRSKPNGDVYFEESKRLNSQDVINLLPSSNTTITQSNTDASQTFTEGDTATWELILDEPVPLLTLGKAPYDLYIYVQNTKLEVHFLGLYKNADGTDQYLDPAGFPWAFLVPGEFEWPLEKANMHSAYPNFNQWYTSAGTIFSDWYKTKLSTYLFSLFNSE